MPEVSEQLRSYVYLYLDPRDGSPFYVGKGVGNRVFSHLEDAAESKKAQRIASIRQSGMEPRLEILRHGLTDDQAALVEAAVIDLLGLGALTNQVRGAHSSSFGRVSVEDVLLTNTAPEVEVREPAMLITINRLYRTGISADELYEATRGIWKVGKRRELAKYALAVFQGVVREVYSIKGWQPAGTSHYHTRDDSGFRSSGRWEFRGVLASDAERSRYLRKSVRRLLSGSNQNPIRYVNC